jgi:hypothetical protein
MIVVLAVFEFRSGLERHGDAIVGFRSRGLQPDIFCATIMKLAT